MGEDLSEVEDVWIGDVSIAGEEFVEALNKFRDLQYTLEELKDDLRDMDVGLDREDAIRLIYARNHSINKSQVVDAFNAIDTIIEADPSELQERLLASKCGDLTLSEAAEVLDDIARLADKYGGEDDV